MKPTTKNRPSSTGNITPLRLAAPFCLAHIDSACYSHIVNEPIVGAFGLPNGKSEISVKGDPSLRETAMLRPRQESRLDQRAAEVLAACEYLLKKTGIFAIYIGFNSSEIRTESIFNPFNYEIHDAEALISEGYLERHFVRVPYKEKLKSIKAVRSTVQKGKLRRYLPKSWRTLLDEERHLWQPLEKRSIRHIMTALGRMRQVEDFYLRNAYVSLSQNLVRASFNCDGMYIVRASEFAHFVEQTI